MGYAVIAENDESQWHDVTGVSYHFPRRYRNILQPGTKVLYYKGVLRKREFREKRLTDRAHYFGTATIGPVYEDATSSKGDRFAEIREFRKFKTPVDIRFDGKFIETVPENRHAFYWRDGVRPVSEETYQRILSLTTASGDGEFDSNPGVNDISQGLAESLASGVEGQKTHRFVSTYERDPRLRESAVRIHGTTCAACGFNFAHHVRASRCRIHTCPSFGTVSERIGCSRRQSDYRLSSSVR